MFSQFRSYTLVLGIFLALLTTPVLAAKVEGAGQTSIPPWFKNSFLDLKEDIADARSSGKRLMIYFHQDGCPYCAELVNNNFSQKEIVDTTRKNFDAIEINMWGDREVTAFDGKTMSEKEFAASQKIWFTPTVVFYNESGKVVLRINGYYPPKQFLAALNYVGGRNENKQKFREYYIAKQSRSDTGKIIEEPFFIKPPHDLKKLARSGPLAVFFEQKDCPACSRLHKKIFPHPDTLEQLNRYQAVQLDMWSKEKLITPSGKETTARDWAQSLGIVYAPSAIFFIDGKEIIRIEAFLKAFHVQSVMDYAVSGAYKTQPSLQRFIQARAERLLKAGKKVNLWK